MNARWLFIRQAIERTLDRARRPKPEGRRPRPRWSVCIGGYPNGWEPPMLQTDDPAEAIECYERTRKQLVVHRFTTVAIFDDNGEGEPLTPDTLRERMRHDIWDHGWHRAADEAPEHKVVGLWKRARADRASEQADSEI